jgi:hypothetical protein
MSTLAVGHAVPSGQTACRNGRAGRGRAECAPHVGTAPGQGHAARRGATPRRGPRLAGGAPRTVGGRNEPGARRRARGHAALGRGPHRVEGRAVPRRHGCTSRAPVARQSTSTELQVAGHEHGEEGFGEEGGGGRETGRLTAGDEGGADGWHRGAGMAPGGEGGLEERERDELRGGEGGKRRRGEVGR